MTLPSYDPDPRPRPDPVPPSDFAEDQLGRWYTYHAPTVEEVDRIREIRAKARELAALIFRHVPLSADRGHALDRVREAVMWANAAIVCNRHLGRLPATPPTRDVPIGGGLAVTVCGCGRKGGCGDCPPPLPLPDVPAGPKASRPLIRFLPRRGDAREWKCPACRTLNAANGPRDDRPGTVLCCAYCSSPGVVGPGPDPAHHVTYHWEGDRPVWSCPDCRAENHELSAERAPVPRRVTCRKCRSGFDASFPPDGINTYLGPLP